MFKIEFAGKSVTRVRELAKQKLQTNHEEWEQQIFQFILNWLDPKIKTIKIFTSGSTGAPKEIAHGKEAVLYSAKMTCDALQLAQGSSALLCLPVNKISGMMMVVRSIYNKMNLYCIQPSASPLSLLQKDLALDFAAFTPMQFSEVLSSKDHLGRANSIAKIILGGEDLQSNLQSCIERMKSEVYATFGMTETLSHIALKKLNQPGKQQYFKTLPGIKISTDSRNCLVINAPALLQKKLVTNDLVNIVSPNEFAWLGRFDNMINSGGIKISPEVLEQQLLPFINAPFFIASIPDARTGEKIIIALERSSMPAKRLNKLKEDIKAISKPVRPKQLFLIGSFVRSENGKIKRKESQLCESVKIDL